MSEHLLAFLHPFHRESGCPETSLLRWARASILLCSLEARISQRSFAVSELTLLQNPEKRSSQGGRRIVVTIIEKLHSVVVKEVQTCGHPTLEPGPASYQERALTHSLTSSGLTSLCKMRITS